MLRHRVWLWLLAGLLASVLAGCASDPVENKGGDDEDVAADDDNDVETDDDATADDDDDDDATVDDDDNDDVTPPDDDVTADDDATDDDDDGTGAGTICQAWLDQVCECYGDPSDECTAARAEFEDWGKQYEEDTVKALCQKEFEDFTCEKEGDCIDGAGTRGPGEECKCPEDCGPDTPYCGKNLTRDLTGPDYCTVPECLDGAAECPEQFTCLEVPDMLKERAGVDSFCERCITDVAGSVEEEGDCWCQSDCAEGFECIANKCYVPDCDPDNPADVCGEHSICEARGGGMMGGEEKNVCISCAVGDGDPLVEFNGECKCDIDCAPAEGAMTAACANGHCAWEGCTPGGGECPEGFRCFEDTVGNGATRCVEGEELSCVTSAHDRIVGERCGCDADCDPSAPKCMIVELDVPFLGVQTCTVCTPESCTPGDDSTCPDNPDMEIGCQDYSQYGGNIDPFCGPGGIGGITSICGDIQ